jgi:putative transposase
MIILLLIFLIFTFLNAKKSNPKTQYSNHRKIEPPADSHHFHATKPDWVKGEVIRLKALLPNFGCRKIAHTFNRLHGHKEVFVGKTYVGYTIKQHQYEIQIMRQKIKNKLPRNFEQNSIWGIDLTGKTDTSGKTHNIFGIIEFQSRASLTLKAIKDKSSISLLRHILDCIERYGKPKAIRTDNESIFTSRLFRFSLKLLGIRHQKIQKAAPWQNGRIERFFGTLKNRLNCWSVNSMSQLNNDLTTFRFWYNHVRPHQNIAGKTPAEAWQGRNVYKSGYRDTQYLHEWEGLLTGYYLPT